MAGTKYMSKKRGAKPIDPQVWIERMAQTRTCVVCGIQHGPKNRKVFFLWQKRKTCGAMNCRKKLIFQQLY